MPDSIVTEEVERECLICDFSPEEIEDMRERRVEICDSSPLPCRHHHENSYPDGRCQWCGIYITYTDEG